MADLSWRDRAACLGADPELWFPVNGAAGAGPAKEICVQKCPVRMECGKNAVALGLRDGVHAGFHLPEQRSSLRRYTGADTKVSMQRRCESCDAVMETRIAVRLCGKCRTAQPRQGFSTEEVREHLTSLAVSPYRLAEVSGVGRTTIREILAGDRKTAAPATLEALLALTPEAVS